MKICKIWYVLCCIVTLPVQVSSSFQDRKNITIYVHGTITSVGLKFLSRFFKDVAFGKPGIHHINQLPAEALLRQDAQVLQHGDPMRFDAQHFYTFGWSGKLSFKARQNDGFKLYEELQKLLLDYKKNYGYFPKVQILTFSHGGNVALNMLKHLPFIQDEQICLDLILVACPVQKVTELLIEHGDINQSYVISSTRDLLQVVDLYRYEKKRYVPSRFFQTSKQNCRQVKVFINNRGLGHLDLMRSFIPHLPYVLNFADTQSCCQFGTLQEVFGSFDGSHKCSHIISCSIKDPEFRFYNVFNLPKVVRGQRKKVACSGLSKEFLLVSL